MRYAPLHSDVAGGPDAGAAHWLKTTDGHQIRVAYWLSPDDRGTVLLFPGRTEYIEKYGRAAAALRDRGFATITVDWRGQGLSDRMIPERATGHVVDFADYQKDVAAMLTHARDLGLPKPFYLVAHSMGGAIGLRALLEALPVKAVAFSSPMWGIQMSAALRPFAWGISAVARRIGVDSRLAPGQEAENYMLRSVLAENTLTSDPDMFEAMREQITRYPELGIGGPSLRWLNEALVEMRRISRLSSPRTPCVTYLGTAEAIVDPAPIHDRMARWPGSTFEIIPGCKHEIMMEVPAIRTRFFDAAAALFDAHR